MKRASGCLFVWCVMALGIAHAVPAQPRYEPPDPPKALPTFQFAGTYWTGKCYVDNYWMIFEEQGTINWGYGQLDAKKVGSTGTWRLEGRELYFEFNHKTLEFKGTVDGQTIKGLTFNDTGSRYPTLLRLTPRPK